MNLYKIAQTVNNGYDTYDSAVVAAPDEETARNTHPGGPAYTMNPAHREAEEDLESWAEARHVKVTLIGMAESHVPVGVVVSSFNAG